MGNRDPSLRCPKTSRPMPIILQLAGAVEVLHMAFVLLMGRRHQHLDVLSQNLLGTVRTAFRMWVEHQHATPRVDLDCTVYGRVEDRSQTYLMVAVRHVSLGASCGKPQRRRIRSFLPGSGARRDGTRRCAIRRGIRRGSA